MTSIKDTLKSVLPGHPKGEDIAASGAHGARNTTANGVEYKGYTVKDGKQWSNFEIEPFTPKTWAEDDVEIEITHCGVCGSDVHTISEGWGEANFPLVVGHEIVGTAVRVGKNVQGIKIGDRVGVGAQIGSCMDCRACHSDNENYCLENPIDTYNAFYADGVKTMGGYSTAIRAHQQFVFPIPHGVASEDAASMLCAGLTVYSPLVRNGCGPGKKVGIVGVGGLGHYAILFAKALGAEVYAFTHTHGKDADIQKMGADVTVHTAEDDFLKKYKGAFDIIISTRDSGKDFDLAGYLSMLYVQGTFISVGLPDEDDPLPGVTPQMVMSNSAKFGGSHVGSKKEALAMLQLAADKKVKPWIEILPMSRAKEAVEGVKNNKVRYRYVLTQDLVKPTAVQA